jgi:hypothetical protein
MKEKEGIRVQVKISGGMRLEAKSNEKQSGMQRKAKRSAVQSEI